MKEIWKDIKGYEGFYQVSNLGQIKSLDRKVCNSLGIYKTYFGTKLSPSIDKNGYLIIHLSTPNIKPKNYKVHRIVAFAFLDLVEGKEEINHIDGIKKNNNVTNLEWCNSSENKKHAFKLGLRNNKGENGPNKLSKKNAYDIKYLLKEKKVSELSKIYNISEATIYAIRKNKIWPHI
jgi:hypothetical protein